MQTGTLRKNLFRYIEGILNSYSQVFFSDNKLFAVIIFLVSFADLYAGSAGLLSVIITNITGNMMGFDRKIMRKGIHGLNSLLVGLSLGIFYSPGLVLAVLIILASILTFFISVSMQGIIGKYSLPSLSMPFVITAWIMTLATRNLDFIAISERGIFTINELYTLGGQNFVRLYEWWNSIDFIKPLKIYFISLGAILFQYNVLSGIIIAFGLLLYSRISFTLSVLGFITAYFFYDFVGADITEINYSYIGFNYILSSMAIGGFFIIPSLRSYLWSLLLIPIVALLSISLYSLFITAALPIYALPFNMIVLIFLYVLKFRSKPSAQLAEVYFQQNSPEKNLYSYENDIKRFRFDLVPMRLPFYGTWTVAQGYDGTPTHKGFWKHALDFIINDQHGKQFKDKGDLPEDYFCFNKPVIAPADGYVEFIIDDIDDNIIGKPNIKDNWGNTVIIKHSPELYSSLSHLRKGSATVKPGDHVKQGNVIGRCGNSGRSPYPHLHFQIQKLPYIGSHTIECPLSYYIEHTSDGYLLKNFSVPEINQGVSNIQLIELLVKAFDFVPGKTFCFEVVQSGKRERIQWEVNTSDYNTSFIKCLSTGSVAYFSNDGNMFMFRHYEGSRKTLLYYFFLAAYRIPLGFYRGIEISDRYPLNLTMKESILFFQDFTAPFIKFLRSVFKMNYTYIDNELFPAKVILSSAMVNSFINKESLRYNFTLEIDESGISSFKISGKNISLTATSCNGL